MHDHWSRIGKPVLTDQQQRYLDDLIERNNWDSMSGPVEVIGYDPRCGVWIRDIKTKVERNVSEFAMHRSIHPIRKTFPHL